MKRESILEEQPAFFQAVIEVMPQEPRLRAAIVFQLLDWSPWLTDIFVDYYEQEGLPDWFIAYLEETLRTIGLCRWEDGSPRPAWDTFLAGLRQLEGGGG